MAEIADCFHSENKMATIYLFMFWSQIMLGLSTHEPHFSLLREEVRFGKAAKRFDNSVQPVSSCKVELSFTK